MSNSSVSQSVHSPAVINAFDAFSWSHYDHLLYSQQECQPAIMTHKTPQHRPVSQREGSQPHRALWGAQVNGMDRKRHCMRHPSCPSLMSCKHRTALDGPLYSRRVSPEDSQSLPPEKSSLAKAGVKTARPCWRCGVRLCLASPFLKRSRSGAAILEPF